MSFLRRGAILGWACLLLLASPCFAPAQVDTGSITGTVKDASGAIIPGARVTITHQATNIHSELQTNAAGFYAAPGLKPGLYSLGVQHPGFRTEVRTGIELRVQDRLEVNFELQVAAAAQEVTVVAAAPLLESESSSLGQVIAGRTISELPLNGRNFIQLALLTAGVLPSNRSAERDSFVANGARAIQNSYLLDGIENKNHIVGFDNSAAQVVQPVVDAIEEFKVQTSTFSAEFGQAAGGVVNVTIKSGSNHLHGSLFEFFRNSKLDARPYFQPPGEGNPRFLQNQYGATAGGPIRRDRSFFFGSWQGTREQSAAPRLATVPILEQRRGNFGKTPLFNPATTREDPQRPGSFLRDPFPGNVIPPELFDPVAARLIELYPAPNLSGDANNFFSNQTERIRADQSNFRFDHKLGSRDSMFARFSFSQDKNLLPAPLPPPANDPSDVFPHTRQLALSETRTFSSGAVNEFRFGFTRSFVTQNTPTERLFEQFGIQGAPAAERVRGLPQFNVNGFATLGTTPPGTQPIPATGSGNLPIVKVSNVTQYLDNFAILRGRHALKFGGDIQFVAYNANVTLNARPAFTFNGSFTANPQSRPGTGLSVADFLLGYMSNTNVSTPARSGLRQRIFQGYVQDDWKFNSRLSLNLGLRYELAKPFFEVNGRQSNVIFEPGSPKFLQVVTQDEASSVGLGAALVNPDYNNFAPRVGVAYSLTPKTVVRAAGGVFYGRDENIGIDTRLVNNPPFFIRVQFPAGQLFPATGPHGELLLLRNGIPPGTLELSNQVNPDVKSFPRQFRTPYVMQWNFNIQRQLPGDILWETAYTGSGGRKLYFPLNMNTPLPGAGAIDPRRPFRGFGNINNYAPLVRSSYNALLVKVEKRFSHGLSFLTSYTWGHSLDNGRNQNDNNDPGPQNARCMECDRGNSNFDVRQRLVANSVWELPFRSRIWGRWQLSGIFSTQGGLPYTVTLNVDNTNSLASARPNRLRDGSLPPDRRTVRRWFDVDAFVVPPGFQFGNSGRNILRGPGRVNFDWSAARTFPLTERWRLQFRSEFFNLFDTPQFGLPNSTLGVTQAGQINSTITAMRQIQFGLRLLF